MEKTLQFIESYSVEQFKFKINASTVEILPSKKKDKFFFSAGNVTGAVSNNYKDNPSFSKVRGTDGKTFWLLHKRVSNAVDTL